VVFRHAPLTDRQLAVLRWIGDGCPAGQWPDDTHKISARALETRYLAAVSRWYGKWRAELRPDGVYYLEHGTYPDPPTRPPRTPAVVNAPSAKPGPERAADVARRARRQATTAEERSALPAARRRHAQRQSDPTHPLKDIPMRYKTIVSRVQTTERHVRAVTEEDATRKVQDEIDRPYGFLGSWTTVGTDMDVVAIESPLDAVAPTQINHDGSLLLSVKAAAKHLGVS
jgi:hypothetical protein